MKNFNKPPGASQWMLERMTSEYHRAASLGDLDEEFDLFVQERGIRWARSWYRRQIWRSLPNFIHHGLSWRLSMSRNHFRIALRVIRRHALFPSSIFWGWPWAWLAVFSLPCGSGMN